MIYYALAYLLGAATPFIVWLVYTTVCGEAIEPFPPYDDEW